MASSRLAEALAAIDAAHARDPNTHVLPSGKTVPYELHYARKMSSYLARRCPSASEPLQLAIRAQHLRRWEVPRASYPMTRVGYHAWRGQLQRRQAEQAAGLCRAAGYADGDAERVARLIRKEGLLMLQQHQHQHQHQQKRARGSDHHHHHPDQDEDDNAHRYAAHAEETQILEDVACLVFLDDQLAAFEKAHDEQKIVGILRKTWAKMSEEGRRLALQVPMNERARELVEKALEDGTEKQPQVG